MPESVSMSALMLAFLVLLKTQTRTQKHACMFVCTHIPQCIKLYYTISQCMRLYERLTQQTFPKAPSHKVLERLAVQDKALSQAAQDSGLKAYEL